MNKYITLIALLAAIPAVTAQTTGPSTNLEAQLLNTDPFPVEAGEDADIRIAIRNTGDNRAEDVTVTLQDNFPFQVKPDRQKIYNIGRITPGEKYYISTEVLVADNAPDGLNDFKVRLENNEVSVTKNVEIDTASDQVNLNLANLETSPADLKPDTENAELNVDIVNNGERQAENVVLDISLPQGFEPVSSLSTRQALGNINAGESKTGSFRFDINESVRKGQATFPATLNYGTNDTRQQMTKSVDFDLFLSGAPKYEVSKVETDLNPGSQGEVRVTVTNTGSIESESTRIRLLDNADLPFSYRSTSAFIGTLHPGQNGTAVFEITPERSATPKDYLVDFEIRGVKDTEVFVEDRTLRLNVQDTQREGSRIGSTAAIAAVITLIVVAGIVVFLFRDRLGF